ncbi:uncharacterized protein A1O9_09270 [Exophiala aquamarina CBS 119918]|uniref:C2H2-type domain-containing protein n=1 Tax=Exophiala aquamarina CBS 119918 TaxID=1182545 RepID=A0A072P6D7_9EURO|nr:uncharacterized protein A1O9_09270 [Exophiala aquamarina CBS 119918]KEF54828.1 hypothetical protein A1O9_09270 [Exophiala aquamarina CBS 119918]
MPTRRYACTHQGCDRAFPKAEHLARHERSHLGLKPFACPVCHRRFGRQDSMLRHSKLHENCSTNNYVADSLTTRRTRNHFSSESTLQFHATASQTPVASSNSNSASLSNNLQATIGLHQNGAELVQASLAHNSPSVSGPNGMPTSDDFGGALDAGFAVTDFGFDWTIASEDIFGLLRSEPSMVNLALPFPQYTQPLSDAQTYLTDSSMERHAPQGSVDASRDAVQAMSNIIKELPAKLVAELENNDVTSSFFDECMDLFFTRFLTTFPLVHKPTFHARECRPTLLLNMLALGSSFIGSSDATIKGESLWSLAHAVVATSWPTLMSHRGPRDACDGVQLVQSAALGQMYSLLSGKYKIRMTSQIFHSLGFYWSHECGMFGLSMSTQTTLPSPVASPAEKLEVWTTWASSEVQLRALLTHYILDGVIAQFSGNPTCAHHAANALPMPASSGAFEATTPDEWIEEMTESTHIGMSFQKFIFALFHDNEAIINQPIPEFAMRVVLESLQSMVLEEAEAGGSTIGTPTRHEICGAMLRLHHYQVTQSSNAAELLLRWHCIFISMTVDTRALCDQICSVCDVSEQIFRPRSNHVRHRNFDVKSWTETCDARRALLHAFAIRELVQNLPLGRSQAIHIPFAVFMAATIQAAFMATGAQVLAVPTRIDWEVAWLNGNVTDLESSSLRDNSCIETQQFLENTFTPENLRHLSRKMSLELHSLRMQLKGISSSWGISHQMDHIIGQWHRSLKVRNILREPEQGRSLYP